MLAMRRAGGARSQDHNNAIDLRPRHPHIPRLQPLHLNALGHGCANLDENIALGLAFRLAVDHIASPRPMRPVCTTRYRAVHQSGRAQIPQNPLARNKRRSEPCSRCAARAALDLKTTTTLSTYAQGIRTSPASSPCTSTPSATVAPISTKTLRSGWPSASR